LTGVDRHGRVGEMHSVMFDRSGGDEGAQAAMEERRRRMPPDNEVAGTVAVDTVLTRNADVAFTLRSVQVLSNGALLSFVLQHRVDEDPAAFGPQRFAFDREVLVGVELPDGSTATSFQGGALGGPGQDAAGPVLEAKSSSGGGRTCEISYWLTPLPAGDLIVVAASMTHDLPEGRVVVPGQAIAAAAGRGQVLWPREPDRQYRPDDVRPPDVPPGGWFARVLGAE
jgi:hypothetical protein